MKKALYIAIAIAILAGACALLGGCGPKPKELAVPDGLELDGKDVLKWKAVEGAESYTVVVNEHDFNVTTNSLDVFEILDAYKTYKIKVAANSSAEGVISSDWSEELVVTQEMPDWLAVEETEDGLGWVLVPVDPSKVKGKLIVPDYVMGKPVVAVCGRRIYGGPDFRKTAITGVIFPDTVKKVGHGTFSGCSQLTRVRLPRYLEKIEDYAFEYTALEEVELPYGLKEIGDYAFLSTALEEVELPYGLTKMDSGAFAYTRLKSVSLPSTLEIMNAPNEAVEINPFHGNPFLTSIKVDEGNKVYKSDGNCVIRIADNMLAVGCRASEIPSYVERIGNYAFYEAGLTSLTLPEGLVSIGKFAFYRNGGLTKLSLPQSLESIGYCAFSECVGLESVDFGARFESMDYDAFELCVNLASITASPENESYFAEGNCLIRKWDNTLVLGCYTSEIPSGVERIGEGAFAGQTRLESIAFPKSVTVIGKGAFMYTGLKELKLPSGLKEIGDNAFKDCMEIVHVALPGSVESVGSKVFGNMQEISNGNFTIQIPSPMTVIVPDNVVSIGVKAFYSTRTTIYTSYAERPEGWYQSLDGIDKWNGKNFVFWGCELAFDQDNLPYLVSAPTEDYYKNARYKDLAYAPERSGYALAGWATERDGDVVFLPQKKEVVFDPSYKTPFYYISAFPTWKLIWYKKTYEMLEVLSDQHYEDAKSAGVERLYPVWRKIN